MTAPSVATRIDQMLIPVTPAPPRNRTTKPPTKAPAMPMSVVTISPPGSSPGRTSLASRPAISPTTIKARIPITFYSFVFYCATYTLSDTHRRDNCFEGGPPCCYDSCCLGKEQRPYILTVFRTGGSER